MSRQHKTDAIKKSIQNDAAGPNGLAVESPVYQTNTLAGAVSASLEEQTPLQRKADDVTAPTRNQTGLPDGLKQGVESLSGFSLDDVRVHYNSPKPRSLNALAYTQGSEIHVAPGQEKHVPHEAWHVVQQKQGRVTPTMQMKGQSVNDDAGLEHEADTMGAKAQQARSIGLQQRASTKGQPVIQQKSSEHTTGCSCESCSGKTIQRKIMLDNKDVDVNAALAAVLKKDNSIPGKISELKEKLTGMIGDETSRTTIEKVVEDLTAEMVKIHAQKKNVANIGLRQAYPDRAFLNDENGASIESFARNDILGKDVESEVGYLVDPSNNKLTGVGLGMQGNRVVQPNEISADSHEMNWEGKSLVHTHPSGSPPTVPSDISVAFKRKAANTTIITREHTFSIDFDYSNKELQKYIQDYPKFMMDVSNAGGKWVEGKNLVYDPDSNMNAQEKKILADEHKKTTLEQSRWTMDKDYGMVKFETYNAVETAFKEKGLKFTGPDKATYKAYREKFYKPKASNKSKASK